MNESLLNLALAVVGGYAIGSLPTAYLLVRYKTGQDIRKAGSGNVGAFNTFDVTSSRANGITVGVIDALKGFIVSGSMAWIFHASVTGQSAAFIATILGHNYPVWLKFKGGRGLATAAGGLFAIGIAYTLVWCILWFIVYRIKKDIHIGNLAAILATPLILLAFPSTWIAALTVTNISGESYQVLAFILSIVVLLSHVDVVHQLRFKRRLKHE